MCYQPSHSESGIDPDVFRGILLECAISLPRMVDFMSPGLAQRFRGHFVSLCGCISCTTTLVRDVRQITRLFGVPEIDVFVSPPATRLPLFLSRLRRHL